MENTFVKSHFKKKLPRRTAAPEVGVYEDEDDMNILGSPEDYTVESEGAMKVCDIAKFVHHSMVELSRLDTLYEVSKASFDLDVMGNKVRFTVENKDNLITP